MAFWIYPVGVVILGGIIKFVKDKSKRDKVCEYCELPIYESERIICDICGASRCKECIVYETFSKIPSHNFPKNYCDVCCQNDKNYRNYQKALHDDPSRIEDYSSNYKGVIPMSEKLLEVTSAQYRNKEEALNELKFRTLFHGGNVLYNVKYHKDTDSSGNFVYSIWSVSGTIAR